jgi:Fe-S-cluster containining protein
MSEVKGELITIVQGRQCGGCTLCCKLLPVKEGFTIEEVGELGKRGVKLEHTTFVKKQNVPCDHQRHGKGCSIYDKRPMSCRAWRCMWLAGMGGLTSRPDRAGYCVDTHPDFIRFEDPDTGEKGARLVVQVWCDPARPDAHRDPALREVLDMFGRTEGAAALIRITPTRAIAVFPPSITSTGEWFEKESELDREPEHTAEQVAAVIEAQRALR